MKRIELLSFLLFFLAGCSWFYSQTPSAKATPTSSPTPTYNRLSSTRQLVTIPPRPTVTPWRPRQPTWTPTPTITPTLPLSFPVSWGTKFPSLKIPITAENASKLKILGFYPSTSGQPVFVSNGVIYSDFKLSGDGKVVAIKDVSNIEIVSVSGINIALFEGPETTRKAGDLTDPFFEYSISYDGTRLVTNYCPGTRISIKNCILKVYDIKIQKEIYSGDGYGITLNGFNPEFSPDGKFITAYSALKNFTVWSTLDWQKVSEIPSTQLDVSMPFIISDDWTRIAISKIEAIYIYSLPDGKLIRTIDQDCAKILTFSKDTKEIAALNFCACRQHGYLDCQTDIHITQDVLNQYYSFDAWDIETGNYLGSFKDFSSGNWSFSKNDSYIKNNPYAEFLSSLPEPYNHDPQILLQENDLVFIYKADMGEKFHTVFGTISSCVQFTNKKNPICGMGGGEAILAVDGNVYSYISFDNGAGFNTGATINGPNINSTINCPGGCTGNYSLDISTSLSPSNKILFNDTVNSWEKFSPKETIGFDLVTNQPFISWPKMGILHSAISTNENLAVLELISSDSAKYIKVFDLRNRQELASWYDHGVTSLSIFPDNKNFAYLYYVNEDKLAHIKIFSLSSPISLKPVEDLIIPNSNIDDYWGQSFSISPDGTMAAIGLRTGEVSLINLKNGEIISKWKAASCRIYFVQFSQDGTMLLTRSCNGHIIWGIDPMSNPNTPKTTIIPNTPTPAPLSLPSSSTVSSSIEITVSSTSEWQYTHLDVLQGDFLHFSAEGQWSYGYEGGDAGYYGYPYFNANGWNKLDSNAILPYVKIGALIGQIGNCPPFLIGTESKITAHCSGQLSLVMNEVLGHYSDNNGEIKVTIEINP